MAYVNFRGNLDNQMFIYEFAIFYVAFRILSGNKSIIKFSNNKVFTILMFLFGYIGS